MELNILKRKPRDSVADYILVDRGEGVAHRFVVGTVTSHSLSHGEWYWGHYFEDYKKAEQYFDEVKWSHES